VTESDDERKTVQHSKGKYQETERKTERAGEKFYAKVEAIRLVK
jgi:hypothetical protein